MRTSRLTSHLDDFRKFRRMYRLITWGIISLFLVIGLSTFGINLWNVSHKETITATVQGFEVQQVITSQNKIISTTPRYLVTTDKGTYLCQDSYLCSSFGADFKFYHLQKGVTYRFHLAGVGPGFFTDHKIIINYVPL